MSIVRDLAASMPFALDQMEDSYCVLCDENASKDESIDYHKTDCLWLRAKQLTRE
jgi:hypothetical protein